jgi:hypothetical protein
LQEEIVCNGTEARIHVVNDKGLRKGHGENMGAFLPYPE